MRQKPLLFLWSFLLHLTSYFLLLTFYLLLAPVPVSASTTLYLGSLEKTYDDAGTVVSEKLYLPAGSATVFKQCSNGTMDQCSNLIISYLYSDHLSSTVLTTDQSGSKNTALQYYPYGTISNQQLAIGQLTTDRLYTNQRLDFSSDLYFYNARYYNPTTSRFVSADKAQGINRFSYVNNNPIKNNDPTGNRPNEEKATTNSQENLNINNDKFVSDLALALATGKGDPSMAKYYINTAKYLINVMNILIKNRNQLKLGASEVYNLGKTSYEDAFRKISANTPEMAALRKKLNLTINPVCNDENSWTVGDFFGYREFFGIKSNWVSSLTPAMLMSLAVAENANLLTAATAKGLARNFGNIYNAHVGGQYTTFAAIFNPKITKTSQEIQDVNEVLFTLRAYQVNFAEFDIPIIINNNFNADLFSYWRGATDDSQSIAERANPIYHEIQKLTQKYPDLNLNLLK